MGRDSSVDLATRYGLDGPGIESRWGTRFSAPVQTGPGAQPTSGPFPGVKRPGRNAAHPPPSRGEVKERVELYLYSPSGLSWPVLGRTLPSALLEQVGKYTSTNSEVVLGHSLQFTKCGLGALHRPLILHTLPVSRMQLVISKTLSVTE